MHTIKFVVIINLGTLLLWGVTTAPAATRTRQSIGSCTALFSRSSAVCSSWRRAGPVAGVSRLLRVHHIAERSGGMGEEEPFFPIGVVPPPPSRSLEDVGPAPAFVRRRSPPGKDHGVTWGGRSCGRATRRFIAFQAGYSRTPAESPYRWGQLRRSSTIASATCQSGI